jgi:hypothetical protein
LKKGIIFILEGLEKACSCMSIGQTAFIRLEAKYLKKRKKLINISPNAPLVFA